jgi:hypothetical protein
MLLYTLQEMSMFKRQDSDLCLLHEWKDRKTLPSRDEVNKYSPSVRRYWLNWENIIGENNILYQKVLIPGKQSLLTQLLVPKILHKGVLKICHDNTFAGHQGLNKTAEKIRRNFYWYQYKIHIRNYIARCITCNKTKNPARKPRAPLGQYHSGYPLDRLGIDIIGPLP